jgi:hypothetical protein
MNKKQRIQSHTLAILTHCMIDTLDEMAVNTEVSINIRERAKDFAKSLEPLYETIFDSKQVSSGSYLNNMNQKISTVIRHNYEQITE